MIKNVMIKSRLAGDDEFGEPWEASFIDTRQLPPEGSQLLSPTGRAFAVVLVEWRYDMGVVHLFCVEYPEQVGPPPRPIVPEALLGVDGEPWMPTHVSVAHPLPEQPTPGGTYPPGDDRNVPKRACCHTAETEEHTSWCPSPRQRPPEKPPGWGHG